MRTLHTTRALKTAPLCNQSTVRQLSACVQIRSAQYTIGLPWCSPRATLYAVPRVSTVPLSQAFETRWAAGTVIGWEEEKVPKTAQ